VAAKLPLFLHHLSLEQGKRPSPLPLFAFQPFLFLQRLITGLAPALPWLIYIDS
jgi:hypothetical protein